jgi:hypothetical protein
MCCLAVVLAVTGSQAAVAAAAIPGHAARLTALHEGRTLIAAPPLTFSVKDIEGEPGNDTPITINLPSGAELRIAGAVDGTFLLIRNIPDGVTVSAGMAAGRVWVVPLREVSTLRLQSKPGVYPEFQLEFHLIGPNSRVLAKTAATVNLRKDQPVAAIGPAPPQPDAPAKPPVQSPPQGELSPRAEAVLLARGKELLEQGGIAAARVIFEDLAVEGSATGALALARSYDPAYLAKSAASAPAPDLAEARKWYERAAELGDLDAKRRLAEIPGG